MTHNIDELMKIAESEPQKKVKFEDTEVEKFIHECGLQRGDEKIATYIIYYHYWKWKKNKRKLKTRRSFFLQFQKHFERANGDDGSAYLLSPEPFELNRDEYFKARALLRRQRRVQRQKNKKK